MLHKLSAFFIGMLCLCSCNQEKRVITNILSSDFIIETISVKNKSLLYNMSINIITFNKEGKMEIPRIVDRAEEGLQESSIKNANWNFYKKDNKYYLNISTSNLYFNGVYHFYFVDDRKTNHLKLILENETTRIVSGKAYFFYRQNESLVNKVVKYTQGKVVN
jgi:hypothetical protein